MSLVPQKSVHRHVGLGNSRYRAVDYPVASCSFHALWIFCQLGDTDTDTDTNTVTATDTDTDTHYGRLKSLFCSFSGKNV